MKKVVISLIVLMAVMCLCGCKNDSRGTHLIEDIEKLSTELQGMSQAEVHEFLGEPVGKLSGFWGDIYQNSEKQFVIVYYDENGKVELVKSADYVIAGNKASENSTERVDAQLLDYIEKTVCLPASASNRTTVCAAKVIGDDRNHLYLYVYKAEYYYQDQKLSRIGVEMFPLSLEIKRSGDEIDIIGHALPAEGTQYGSSMRDIFPNSIIEKISLLTQDDFAHIEALADDRAKIMLDYGHSGNISVDDFYN